LRGAVVPLLAGGVFSSIAVGWREMDEVRRADMGKKLSES
jgi:hypothetical protein